MADMRLANWEEIEKGLVARGIRPGTKEYENVRKQYESLILRSAQGVSAEPAAEEGPGAVTETQTTVPPSPTENLGESFKYGLQQGTVPLLLQKAGLINEPKERNVEGFLNKLAYGAGAFAASPELYVPTPGVGLALGGRLGRLAARAPLLAGTLHSAVPLAARFGVHGGLQGGLREGAEGALAGAGEGVASGIIGGQLGALARYGTLKALMPKQGAKATATAVHRIANLAALPAEVAGFTVPAEMVAASETAEPGESVASIAKRGLEGSAEASGENLALIGLMKALGGGGAGAATLLARRARARRARVGAKRAPAEAEAPVEAEQPQAEAKQPQAEAEQPQAEAKQPQEARHTGEGPGDALQGAKIEPQAESIGERQQKMIAATQSMLRRTNAEMAEIKEQLETARKEDPLFLPLRQKYDELLQQKNFYEQSLRDLGVSPEDTLQAKAEQRRAEAEQQRAEAEQQQARAEQPPVEAREAVPPPAEAQPPPEVRGPMPRREPTGLMEGEVPPPVSPEAVPEVPPPKPPVPPGGAPVQAGRAPVPPKAPGAKPKAKPAAKKPVEAVAEVAKQRLQSEVHLDPIEVLKIADAIGVNAKDMVVKLQGVTRDIQGKTMIAFPEAAREFFGSAEGATRLKKMLQAETAPKPQAELAPQARPAPQATPARALRQEAPAAPPGKPAPAKPKAGKPSAETPEAQQAMALWRYVRDRAGKEMGGDVIIRPPRRIESSGKYVINAVLSVGERQIPIGRLIVGPNGLESAIASERSPMSIALDKYPDTHPRFIKFKDIASEGQARLKVAAVNKAAGGERVAEVVPEAPVLEQRPGEGQQASPPSSKPGRGKGKGGVPAVLRPSQRVARKAKERSKQE